MIKAILNILILAFPILMANDSAADNLVIQKKVKVYYIDPDGSDLSGDGSALKPWLSLSNACSKVTISGSIIHVNPGKYYETRRCDLASGVNIEGEGDVSHIISNVKENAGTISIIENTGGQSIKHIKLDGGLIANVGIYIAVSNDVIISNCTIIDMNSRAMTLYSPPSQPPLSGLTIEYCNFINTGTTFSINRLYYSNIHHCIFNEDKRPGEVTRIMYAQNCRGIKYHHNISHKPSNNGKEYNFAFEAFSCCGMEISDNEFYQGGQPIDIVGTMKVIDEFEYGWWIHHNKFEVPVIDHPNGWYNCAISFEASNEDCKINNNNFNNFTRCISIGCRYVSRQVRNITISYNICKNTGGPHGHTGRTFQIGSDTNDCLIENIFLYNNVFSSSGNLSCHIWISAPSTNEVRNLFILNNIIEKAISRNSLTGWITITGGVNVHDFIIRNNILYDNYNSNEISGSISQLTYEENIFTDPLFMDPGNDFHLKSGSPAINAGIDVGLGKDYDEVPVTWKPDIGVYEYVLDINNTTPLYEK